jgi:hypothetical protein
MFYKILNFPKIPDKFSAEIFDTVKSPTNAIPKKHQNHPGFEEYRQRKLIKTNGEIVPTVMISRYPLSNELNQWLLDNVHPDPVRQHISFYSNSSDSMGPHVDHERNEVWLYILQSGGKKVETVWYQEHGQPITRPDIQGLTETYMNTAKCDYRDLTELERFEIPLNTWVSINSSVIHSVEGLTGHRLAIQITP